VGIDRGVARGAENDGEEVTGGGIVDERGTGLEEDSEREWWIGRLRSDGLEGGGEFVADGSDKSSLEIRPAGEARAAVSGGPLVEPCEGSDEPELLDFSFEMKGGLTIGMEGPGLASIRQEQGVTSRRPALKDRSETSKGPALPGGGKSACRETRYVGKIIPTRTGG
jgi:hypothetical protein